MKHKPLSPRLAAASPVRSRGRVSHLRPFSPASLMMMFLLCAGSATIAHADVITFTGSRDVTNAPLAAPNIGRCGAPPNLLVSLPPGTGTSNLGSFTSTESHCVNVTTGDLSNGLFTFDLGGGNTFFGTYVGTVALPLPPPTGVAAVSEMFTITGGTGIFTAASGSLIATGVLTFNANGTTNSRLDFSGTINTVPEPMTVVLLGTGLAGIAAKVRKRRKAISTSTTV